jgi:copper transport protein
MELTVDPARVGPNEMHVYLFDRRDGRQYEATKELTVTAELPEKRIEPIELEATKAGPGHYVVSGAALGLSGKWTLRSLPGSAISTSIERRSTRQSADRRQSVLACKA